MVSTCHRLLGASRSAAWLISAVMRGLNSLSARSRTVSSSRTITRMVLASCGAHSAAYPMVRFARSLLPCAVRCTPLVDERKGKLQCAAADGDVLVVQAVQHGLAVALHRVDVFGHRLE